MTLGGPAVRLDPGGQRVEAARAVVERCEDADPQRVSDSAGQRVCRHHHVKPRISGYMASGVTTEHSCLANLDTERETMILKP